ncbi:MAG: hypothetical protein MJ146_03900 [Clostridia bacterium]|nr:hypothetical protein [Clostridia bacterium]
MKKRLLSLIMAVLIAVVFLPCNTFAETDINDDSVYYISSYVDGGCVLCANVYMMRRAAMLRGYSWKGISRASAQKKLCTSGTSMKWDYTYHKGDLTFVGARGTLPGGYEDNKAKLKSLLKKHPEGIVVHGYDNYTTHGVLITEFKNGTFYAVDSANNHGDENKGIVKFKNTTLRSLGGCFQYWYLKKVTVYKE